MEIEDNSSFCSYCGNKVVCSNCGAVIKPEDNICHKCGVDVAKLDDNDDILEANTGKRYSSLRSIAKMYTFLAYATAIICIILCVVSAIQGSVILMGTFLFGCILGYIGFMSLAESIMVFIDIEENTRETVELLKSPKKTLEK